MQNCGEEEAGELETCQLYAIGLTVLLHLSYGTFGSGVSFTGASLPSGVAAGSSAHPHCRVTQACR